jgi:hypothetical protein
MLPVGVVSGSAGVFFFLRDLVAGQERFQDCGAGLDFRDVSVQLGHYLPDLVIARAHGLPSPDSSSPSSADRSASLPATLVQVGYRVFGQGADLGSHYGLPRHGQGGGLQRPDLAGPAGTKVGPCLS